MFDFCSRAAEALRDESLRRYSPALDFIDPAIPLAKPVPPIGNDWIHQPSMGGTRAQIHREKRGVRIYTQAGKLLNHRFPSLLQPLLRLPICVIDAELVTLNDRVTSVAFATDLLTHWPANLRTQSFRERRFHLDRLLRRVSHPVIRPVQLFHDGLALLLALEDLGLEGVISKHLGAHYRSGPNPDWVIVKTKAWKEAKKQRSGSFNPY